MTATPGTLGCPRCGAPASPDQRACAFCGTVLALVACPVCFGQVFRGTRHCSHCGAEARRDEKDHIRAGACPHCRVELVPATVGSAALQDCAACGGIWVEVRSFEKICAEREQRAAVLGAARLVSKAPVRSRRRDQRYVPCPECGRLMNRVNFAQCSGVLIDVCKQHGAWFDDQELRRIVEFVHGGGLDKSRARAKSDLEDERRRLRQQELALLARQGDGRGGAAFTSHRRARAWDATFLLDTVAAARDLLKHFRN